MKTIRLIKFLSLSAATAALFSTTAFASVELEVPDAGSSALMLCGAIAAFALARRRLAK